MSNKNVIAIPKQFSPEKNTQQKYIFFYFLIFYGERVLYPFSPPNF